MLHGIVRQTIHFSIVRWPVLARSLAPFVLSLSWLKWALPSFSLHCAFQQCSQFPFWNTPSTAESKLYVYIFVLCIKTMDDVRLMYLESAHTTTHSIRYRIKFAHIISQPSETWCTSNANETIVYVFVRFIFDMVELAARARTNQTSITMVNKSWCNRINKQQTKDSLTNQFHLT